MLLGADDYDALRETLTVLADTELLRDHAEGIAALEAGDSVDADGLDRIMRSAGCLPQRSEPGAVPAPDCCAGHPGSG